MIRKTFQILDKISKKKELNIWNQGIDSWDAFLRSNNIRGISRTKKKYFDRQILSAKKALHLQDSEFFTKVLAAKESWRLYDYFKDSAVFLDIEADGLGEKADITVIGLYDGIRTKTMIKGINLDFHVLKSELRKYKIIITFNGASFDLPFIKKRYDIIPATPHIDLKNTCARLGFTGGLKEIERSFGIRRNKIIEKFSGGDPLALLKIYKATGDDYYLKLLVEYNEDDVINLKKIMQHCYDGLSKEMMDTINCNVHPKIDPVSSWNPISYDDTVKIDQET